MPYRTMPDILYARGHHPVTPKIISPMQPQCSTSYNPASQFPSPQCTTPLHPNALHLTQQCPSTQPHYDFMIKEQRNSSVSLRGCSPTNLWSTINFADEIDPHGAAASYCQSDETSCVVSTQLLDVSAVISVIRCV